jgi:hypothetical protein
MAHLPAIARLRLPDDALNALTIQGFVSAERRGESVYYKLRYRLYGKQRVRYLGDVESARAVADELAVLQHDVRLRRELAALSRAGMQRLRAAKRTLQPFLEARGFHFHGQAIRQRRAARKSPT